MGVDVDTTQRGTTELRIHGVSGTPPEVMLQHPHARLVAGDRVAGFYRRWFPAHDSTDVPNRNHREAYSWGGLTSGASSRALWLLLLPFALVNVASWAEPGLPHQAIRRRRVLEALLRLFALSLTGTVILAVAAASLDLLAWQCAEAASRCAGQSWLAGLLAWLGPPGRRLAAGALLPAVGIALLWFLGNRTWHAYESARMPTADADDDSAPHDFSLADPRFWEGQLPVRRLQALHITAGWALLALLVAEPVRRHLAAVASAWAVLASAVVTVAVVVVTACATGVLVPQIADRCGAGDQPSDRAARLEPVWRAAPWAGAGLFAVAAVLAWFPDGAWSSQGALPLLNAFLQWGFVVQAVLLVVLTGLNMALPRDPRPLVRIGVAGHALPLLVSIGWLLAGGFAAGGTLRVAQWLGKPVSDLSSRNVELAQIAQLASSDSLADRLAAIQAPEPLLVPALYSWVALIAAVLVLVVVPVLVAAIARRVHTVREQAVSTVRRRHPDSDPWRVRAVGRALALARFSDEAPRYLGILVLAVLLLVMVGTIGYQVDWAWPQQTLPALTDFGSWMMGALALLLVALGRAAYRTPQLRRTVGILWDLASFWPRAAHPLAPPCYCERVLPDLVYRAKALTAHDDDRLLLSAHSQGTVITLAAVLQLPPSTAQRTALLTYGSPLTRLYAAFFPGYVNRQAYQAVARRLGSQDGATTGWPWRNLYRLTDPIGGWLLNANGDNAVDDVDHRLEDPIFERLPGDPVWPPTRGHSDYWIDPDFDAVRARVLQLRG